MDHHNPAVYILASKYEGVLYIGVTSNLPQRIWQHKHKLVDGFSRQYDVVKLFDTPQLSGILHFQ